MSTPTNIPSPKPPPPSSSASNPHRNSIDSSGSPSTRPIGIASPPIPNIPPRYTASPSAGGRSYKPDQVGSYRPRSLVGPGSLTGSYGGVDGAGGLKKRSSGNFPIERFDDALGRRRSVVSPNQGGDLDLGEKRSATAVSGSVPAVSNLSAALGGPSNTQPDGGKSPSGKSSKDSSASGKDGQKDGAAAAGEDEDEASIRGRSREVNIGRQESDGKRQDLSVPPLERHNSDRSVSQAKMTTLQGNHSGTSTPNNTNGTGNGNGTNHTQTNSSDIEISTPGATATPTNIDDIPEEEKIRILRRHLVSAEERQAGETQRRTSIAPGTAAIPGGKSPLPEHDPSTKSSRAASMAQTGRPNVTSNGLRPDMIHGESAVSASSGHVGAGMGGESGDEDGGGATPRSAGQSGFSIRQGEVGSGSRKGSMRVREGSEMDESFPIPYDAVGADITHEIYKYQQTPPAHRRSRSVSALHRESSMGRFLDPSLQRLHEPGGMRRHYVVQKAVERGEEQPVVLRSFVDFLFLYGHFAGEDLDEDEDDEDDDSRLEAGESAATRRSLSRVSEGAGETAPLLGSRRAQSSARLKMKRSKSVGPHGDATTSQAVLMLLKGFVGTGVLFLGKAFFNGGILFSTIVMLAIATISLWAFLLLVKTRLVIPGSFGDIGGHLYGEWMRRIILTSIALSQIGFVCAYTIFVAENLQAFILAVSKSKSFIPIKYLIAAQLIVVLPLSMIRNLAALSSTALIADAFILIGLIYIGSNEVSTIVKEGVADVALFNPKDFSLLIGTAVFAFEGIGLIIPITEAMREPHKFPKILTGVMIGVATLFAGFGVLGYAAYGSNIQTVVIVNLPQEDKFVQAVQFLYTIAIVLSLPLQLFPAVRIMETSLFVRSGKHNPRVKWQKNIFRAGTVLACSMISWAGASNLDGFVSFIGSFACVPLCFIYPPMLHLRARAKTRTQKGLDIALIIFGIITTVYTTIQTIRVLVRPAPKGKE